MMIGLYLITDLREARLNGSVELGCEQITFIPE